MHSSAAVLLSTTLLTLAGCRHQAPTAASATAGSTTAFVLEPQGGPDTRPVHCRISFRHGQQLATIVADLPDGRSYGLSMPPGWIKAPADDELAPAWDRVFGQGYYGTHVIRQEGHVRLDMEGFQGGWLKLEICRPARGEAQAEGIAVDQAGRVFKVEGLAWKG
ncbi:hypothetical protein [Mesoterricola sediminis]|uniref:Uncharacterized protein n=1 Tax=Mesoterricola sediminis TaxID=2927980 RepID=A0AA48GYQ5_9BACT|nr:hypothetical protein [Mesoterricola sediminis]BDU76860.1 hypothetical protein METESE_18180 [Mesoterricola sediminis]